MNISFKIEFYQSGKKASLYTIKLNGETESEFDKFLSDSNLKNNKEFESFLIQINEILEKYGCQDRFFKLNESKLTDAVVALWRGKIRLYCCRYPNIILIAGSGGIKNTRTYQEDKKLNHCVQLMAEVSKRIDDRIKDREILIVDNKFVGNLIFKEH